MSNTWKLKFIQTWQHHVNHLSIKLKPILLSSKEENVLVLLKYQVPFIEYAILESCLSFLLSYLAFLFRLRISTDCEFTCQSLFK